MSFCVLHGILFVLCSSGQARKVTEQCSRLAVFVVGVTERLIIEPTLRHVVAPAAKAGWCVDYFLQLSGAWNGLWLDRRSAGQLELLPGPYTHVSQDKLTEMVLKQAILNGARHISIRLTEAEVIDPITPDSKIVLGARFSAYPPLVSERGRNQLRRLKALEELWNHSIAYTGGTPYDFVVVSRDDVYWAGDLNLDWFAEDSRGAPGLLYTYRCGGKRMDWIGDKVRVITGSVADKLMRMYSDIYYNPAPLFDESHTAEVLLQRSARVHNVTFVEVRLEHLPFYVVQHVNLQGFGVTPCLRYTMTAPCINASIQDVLHGRFGRPCFWDTGGRQDCMGRFKLAYPGCFGFKLKSGAFRKLKYDWRLDYR